MKLPFTLKNYQKLLLCASISYCGVLSGAYLLGNYHEHKGLNPTNLLSNTAERDYDFSIAQSRYVFCNNITLNSGFFDEEIVRTCFSFSGQTSKTIDHFISKKGRYYLHGQTYNIKNINESNRYRTLLYYFSLFQEGKNTENNYKKIKSKLVELNKNRRKLGTHLNSQHFFLIPILFEQAYDTIVDRSDTPLDTTLSLATLRNINTIIKYRTIPNWSDLYYEEIKKNMHRVKILKEKVKKEKTNESKANYKENIDRIYLICTNLHQFAEIGYNKTYKRNHEKYKQLLSDIRNILYDKK